MNLRKLIREARLWQWEVAEHIGITEFTLCRWLRHPTDEQTARIMKAIDEMTHKLSTDKEAQ